MTVNYSLNMMLHAIVVISFVVVSAATLRVDYTSFEEKEHGKAYPSRTIIDKDGQFIRLIGPFYAKVELNGFKLPLHYWKPVNISAIATLTVEIPTFFANGEVKFDGQPFYKVNGNVDQCIASGFDCPYLPGFQFNENVTVSIGDLGLFPGWYEAKFELFTTDKNQKRFKVGGVEFKIKVLDA